MCLYEWKLTLGEKLNVEIICVILFIKKLSIMITITFIHKNNSLQEKYKYNNKQTKIKSDKKYLWQNKKNICHLLSNGSVLLAIINLKY